MKSESPRVAVSELDRLQELANIGAGHAASAFGMLTGRSIWMGIPRVRKLERVAVAEAGKPVADPAHCVPESGVGDEDGWSTGVFFEFDGYLDALVGILFRASAGEELMRCVVGIEEDELLPHVVESALAEVGNILASHIASAIADTVGERLLPSIPSLAMNHAEQQLALLIQVREGPHPIRIECELMDESGGVGGLLVLIPSALPA